FENATDGFLGTDTYQLFNAADLLTEEYQLLKDLIDDYNSGVIPAEDKDYAVKVMSFFAKQINEHAGAIEFISYKLSWKLDKLYNQILVNFLDYQSNIRQILILDNISKGKLNPSILGISATPEPDGTYEITEAMINAAGNFTESIKGQVLSDSYYSE